MSHSQSYGVSSSHVWMWELDHKEGWALKNWCFWIVVLEKNFESPLHSKEIKPVCLKGNQHWIFTGRTDAEAEAPILWPAEVKSQLIGKDPDAGEYKNQEEKGITEDKMIGLDHWLNGHEFEQACYSPWGHKELDTNEQLNNNNSLVSSELWQCLSLSFSWSWQFGRILVFGQVFWVCLMNAKWSDWG